MIEQPERQDRHDDLDDDHGASSFNSRANISSIIAWTARLQEILDEAAGRGGEPSCPVFPTALR
jgi:hypothetical protein